MAKNVTPRLSRDGALADRDQAEVSDLTLDKQILKETAGGNF